MSRGGNGNRKLRAQQAAAATVVLVVVVVVAVRCLLTIETANSLSSSTFMRRLMRI